MFPSVLNMLLSSSYLYKLFPKSKFFGRERMTWWGRNDIRQVDVVTGCFMLVRRKAIEQVGMMDERFFMYCEEADWCYRFKQTNWKVLFTPSADIVHVGGQSTAQKPASMLVHLRLSILKFIRKHKGRAAYMVASFLTTIFFVVRLPVLLFLSVFAPERRGESVRKMRGYVMGITKVILCSN